MIGPSKNKANFTSLTPLSFLYRTVSIFPDKKAWVYGNRQANYQELYLRSKNLAIAITNLGIRKGEVVSVMLPNVPEMPQNVKFSQISKSSPSKFSSRSL